MYYEITNLINQLIFNGSAVAGTAEHSALVLVSLLLALAIFYLPFKAIISAFSAIFGKAFL